MLRSSCRKKKIKEMGTEDEWYAKQFEIRGDKPPPLDTSWDGSVFLRKISPHDWPPSGWEVDRKELEYIREAHKLMAERVWLEDLEKDLRVGEDAAVDKICFDRYKVFLKQYNEWVEANTNRLEEESYKYDQDFYPGRRKRGNDYEEGMLWQIHNAEQMILLLSACKKFMDLSASRRLIDDISEMIIPLSPFI